MTSPILEKASSGNPEAIAAIINKSLQKNRISAAVDLDHGDLHVMLDAKQVPSEAAANYIFNGIKKLNVEPAYDLHVYGRRLGEPFATWCHDYELKTRPFALTNSSDRKKTSSDSNSGFTIRISGIENNELNLDLVQVMGFLGIVITILGIFSPIFTAPIVGTLNYFRNGAEEAIALIVLTAFSVFFLIRKNYSWLYGSSVWAFLLVAGTFWYYQSLVSDIKAATDRDLAGNPFRGLADIAMAATGLSWGWSLLFLGTGLVVLTAYLRKRKLDKQALLSLGLPPLIAVIITVVAIFYFSITSPAQANRARESEARTYIGSINRGQQAFRLENPGFADDIDQIGIGISSETDYYNYEVTTADDDMTAATATAKQGGLRSFVGAVFVLEDDEGFTTTKAILCQSNRPSRSAPSLPSVSADGELQCASGSSEE